MTEARFILSKKVLREQVERLRKLGLKISYSYKTNQIVGNVLQEMKETEDLSFSIHAEEEIGKINDKKKIWFFTQAESEEELKGILEKGIENFVVDNEVDLERILNLIRKEKKRINLSLRMKFLEHRVGTGKYFVYGMPSVKVNELILKLESNRLLKGLGVHIHRKSQNTSEWEIVDDLEDSLTKKSLESISFVNLGGGLPAVYRNSNEKVFDYIFEKLVLARKWLEEKNIDAIIEPGRFLAAPCIRLETEIIQKYANTLIVNTTLYNCALDTFFTGTRLRVLGEKGSEEDGDTFLIKGNSPTRDDIFRYKVKLDSKIKVGDKIVFLNAGAYNYTTDFFGYKKLETEILEDFV